MPTLAEFLVYYRILLIFRVCEKMFSWKERWNKAEKYDPDYELESCMGAGELSVFDGSPLEVSFQSANHCIISAFSSF